MLRIVSILVLASGLLLPQVEYGKAAADTEAEVAQEGDEEVGEEVKSMFDRQASRIERKPNGIHQPWKLLRSIQNLQDDMIIGGKDTAKAYRVLLLHSANWMRKLDDSVWQFERNLDAVAVYLLIGGDVELGYKALQKSKLPRQHKLLLQAAVAYSERDVNTAFAIMSRIDHMSLPASVAGQVALAKAMVYSSSDLKIANDYLQQARMLAPGTLIEEAALRRSIRIAAELNSMKKLRYYSRTYLHRFPNSHFFTDFLRNASYALVKLSNRSGKDVIADFEHLLENINRKQQINVSQYVARKAVLTGRFRLADWAAEYAFERVDKDSKFHTRLKLYSAAGKVLDHKQTEKTAQMVEGLNPGHLESFDKKVFEAVKILSNRILRDPAEGLKDSEEGPFPLDTKMDDDEDKLKGDNEESDNGDMIASLQAKRLEDLTKEMNTILEQKKP